MLVYILSPCYFDFVGLRNHEAYIYNSILLIASIKSSNKILKDLNNGVNSGTTNVAKNIKIIIVICGVILLLIWNS